MQLTSLEFGNNELIPSKFTCEGEDINPPLIIEDIPQGTQSLALVVDDPDALGATFVHWVVWNIPLVSRIEAGSVPGNQGVNDFGRKNYGGPCPPSGTHRYFFKIYALDIKLTLPEEVNKESLEKAMQGHILDKTQLIGLYRKKR